MTYRPFYVLCEQRYHDGFDYLKHLALAHSADKAAHHLVVVGGGLHIDYRSAAEFFHALQAAPA